MFARMPLARSLTRRIEVTRFDAASPCVRNTLASRRLGDYPLEANAMKFGGQDRDRSGDEKGAPFAWNSPNKRRRMRSVSRALVAILPIVLTSLPAFGFRTAADEPSFAGTPKVKWEVGQIPINFSGRPPTGISNAEVERATEGAFARWSDANAEIAIELHGWAKESAVAGDGVNTVQFISSGWVERGFDKSAPGLTDISYSQNSRGDWVIAEADIYINADTHSWIISGRSDSDERALDSVLTHEGGHFLGLWHPCEVGGSEGAPDCGSDSSFAQATMYPVYSSAQSSLAEDDIAGIKFLYGASSCVTEGCPDGRTCAPEGCLVQCGDFVCGPHEQCTADGCWPEDECYGIGCSLRCKVDSDCGVGQRCVTNECSGIAPAGDPCAESAACESSLCANGEFCLASCSDCATGVCEQSRDGGQTCETAKLPVGANCESPEDCAGGECLTGAEKSNVCTRTCHQDGAKCPDDWSCSKVDETQVCVPDRVEPRGGGGCSIAALPRSQNWLLAVTLGLMLQARRKRRSRVHAELGT